LRALRERGAFREGEGRMHYFEGQCLKSGHADKMKRRTGGAE